MKIIDNYLKKLNEKEWDERDKWKEYFDRDLLSHLISKDGESDESEININRHSIQPVLLNLIKNTGGDYRGRSKMRNSDHGDFSGIDYILKNMPKGWEEKLKKYVKKLSKKHNEEQGTL